MTPDAIEQQTLGRESIPADAPPGHPSQVARRRRIAWLIGLALVLALVVWVIHHRLAASHRQPGFAAMMGGPLPVSIAKVSTADVPVVVDALGTVTPLATVTVRPQVTGPIVKIAFKEGQMIRKGGLLAEIDPRPYQAVLDQALGQLGRDQAVLAGARSDLVRYRQLLAQNSVAQQTYSDELATVNQDEAAIEADRATIETARLNLSYCRITSPVSGLVGLRQVDLGNLVQANQTTSIATVTQMQPMSVLFTVPENDLSQIFQHASGGRKLTVQALDRGMRPIATGTLSSIDNQINTSTGTLQLRALFDNSHSELFPNEFVNVKLVVDTLSNQIVVPGAAVQNGPSSNFVYIVKPDHTVTMRTVTTGPTDGNDIAIMKGLTPGETVVTDGADQLRDGAKVLLPGEQPPAFANGAGASSAASSRCARVASLMKSATGSKATHLAKVSARLGCGGGAGSGGSAGSPGVGP